MSETDAQPPNPRPVPTLLKFLKFEGCEPVVRKMVLKAVARKALSNRSFVASLVDDATVKFINVIRTLHEQSGFRLYVYQAMCVAWMIVSEAAYAIILQGGAKGSGKGAKTTGARSNDKLLTLPRCGMLFDDMGMGKTIKLLSLILSDDRLTSFGCGGGRGHDDVQEGGDEGEDGDEDEGGDDDDDGDEDEGGDAGGRVDIAEDGCATRTRGATLVVAPQPVLATWKSEIIKFLGPSFPFVEVTSIHRKELIPPDTRIVLTTFSNFQHVHRYFNAEHDVPKWVMYERAFDENGGRMLRLKVWKRLVVDEAHVITNPKTLAHRSLSKVLRECTWVATGTPIKNKATELDSLWKFTAGPSAGLCNMKRFTWRDTRNKVGMQLGELRTEVVRVAMTPAGERMAAALEAAIKGNELGNRRIALMSALGIAAIDPMLVHSMKADLSMLDNIPSRKEIETDGTDETGDRMYMGHMTRALVRHLATHDHKSIVFAHFRSVISDVRDVLSRMGMQVRVIDGSENDFNKRKIDIDAFCDESSGVRVLVMQTQCGGVGLNLQIARVVYFMSSDYNPCNDQQALARSYRLGQTHPVRCIQFFSETSVERNIFRIQRRKMDRVQAHLRDASHVMLDAVMNDMEADEIDEMMES